MAGELAVRSLTATLQQAGWPENDDREMGSPMPSPIGAQHGMTSPAAAAALCCAGGATLECSLSNRAAHQAQGRESSLQI